MTSALDKIPTLHVQLPRPITAIHQIEITSRCNLSCKYCIEPEQLVPTPWGPVRAKDLEVGTLVFGNDGTTRVVTSSVVHHEPVVELKPSNLPAIAVSNTHLMETLRGWVPAGEVTIEDWVRVPRLQLPEAPSTLDLTQYDKEFSFLRTPCVEQVAMDAEIAWLFGLYTAEGSTGVPKTRSRRAHGPNRNYVVNFSLGAHETALLAKTEELLRRRFGVKVGRIRQGNAERIYVTNARLATFFAATLGPEGIRKRIPFELLGSGLAGPFLCGLYDGDGHRGSHNGSQIWNLSTSYTAIRDGAAALLLSLKILPNVHTGWHPDGVIDGRPIVSTLPQHQVRVHGKRVQQLEACIKGEVPGDWEATGGRTESRLIDGQLWLRVFSISVGSIMRPVVGVEVDGDHTIVVGHLATHNCPSPLIVKGQQPNRKAVDMPLATYLRALEWVKHFVRAKTQTALNLAGIGESTLHHDFVAYVKLAREAVGPDVQLIWATNGLICDEALVQALLPYKPVVWVSLHRPEKAGRALEIYRKYGLLGGISIDPSVNANSWGGQVEYHDTPNNTITCQWLREGKAFVLADGRISTCCLDASGTDGVMGHVDDEIGSVKIKPYTVCENCYQAINIAGLDQWKGKGPPGERYLPVVP